MAVGVGVSGMPLKGGHGMGVRLPHAGTPLVGQAVRSAIADARSRRPDRREQPDAASARICVRLVADLAGHVALFSVRKPVLSDTITAAL